MQTYRQTDHRILFLLSRPVLVFVVTFVVVIVVFDDALVNVSDIFVLLPVAPLTSETPRDEATRVNSWCRSDPNPDGSAHPHACTRLRAPDQFISACDHPLHGCLPKVARTVVVA